MNFAKALSTAMYLALLSVALATAPARAQAPVANQGASETQPADGLGAPAKPAQASGEPIDASVHSILVGYGKFQTIPAYGEVWIPTSVPPDWRPYAACHWVNSRTLGWYYDDRTPWGAIIHHYGRWTHDATLGWVWVPGTEFSPGWVSWRASPAYVGWAPLPPNGDLKAASAAVFDKGGFWTFMEVSVFDRGCGKASVLPVAQENALLIETQPVTAVAFAQGLWVAVLPDYIIGRPVDISVSFKQWPSHYVISVLAKWNVAWNAIDVKTKVNVVDCKKKPPPHLTQNDPPPRRTACGTGYLQPDGRCGIALLINPPPPDRLTPTCPDGRRPDIRGLCGPQPPPPPAYTAIPAPSGPPPVVVPVPVGRPPAIVAVVPPPAIKIEGCRRPGFVRQPDGHCRNPAPPIVVNAPPPVNKPPTLVVAPPGDNAPSLARCGPLSGVAKRRCLDQTIVQTNPRPSTAVMPAQGGAQGRPPEATRPSRPVFAAAARPRPSIARPSVFRPIRPTISKPSFARPSTVRPRPTVRRPAFRPSRPRPAAHAVFHPARPQIRSRPAPRRPAARPVSRRRR